MQHELQLTETALLGPFRLPKLTNTAWSSSDSGSTGYRSGRLDEGGGSGGRTLRVDLTFVEVARPVLVRTRLIVLKLTVASTGAPLMVVTFRETTTLGIAGMGELAEARLKNSVNSAFSHTPHAFPRIPGNPEPTQHGTSVQRLIDASASSI